MFNGKNYKSGLEIEDIAICDFSTMRKLSNEDIVSEGRGKADTRLMGFISKKMGIKERYWVHENQDALDLSRQALKSLVDKNPNILEEAEFLILAGISNPMPTVCTSALLACELEFKNTSCWDIKSGCSTGVLALMQALNWFQNGAKKGVIVCSETFSKFTNKDVLQMAVSIGDGASAMIVQASSKIKVRGIIHGTDSAYLKTMYVPGKYPIDYKNVNPLDYTFHFEAKADALEKMVHYWTSSLKELLEISNLKGEDIDHYFSHQVDGKKNIAIGKSSGIAQDAVAMNFEKRGNMGCPTIFINYHNWKDSGKEWSSGEKIIFHAVGGGLSWAGICLEKE